MCVYVCVRVPFLTFCRIVADVELAKIKNPVTLGLDYQKVIQEIMLAAPGGILLSELSEKFEVNTGSWHRDLFVAYVEYKKCVDQKKDILCVNLMGSNLN